MFLTYLRNFSNRAAKPTKDMFGLLSSKGRNHINVRVVETPLNEEVADTDFRREFDIIPRKDWRWYATEISKHARKGSTGLKKALELYETMKVRDRLEPTCGNISALLYGCAKAGHPKKAFDIYQDCLVYLRKPTNSIVTCLIKSCGESPFKDYGSQRLDWFLKHLAIEYNRKLNLIQSNAAIQSYGKLGQIEKASFIVQMMIDDSIQPNTQTFNSLLIGCCSREKDGASIAMRIFKRMNFYDVKPNVTTFKLLLRCIRDCGLGSPDVIIDTVSEIPILTAKKLLESNLDARGVKSNHSSKWQPILSDVNAIINSCRIQESSDEPRSRSDNNLIVRKDDSSPSTQEEIFPMKHSYGGSEGIINLLSNDHSDLVSRIQEIRLDKLRTKSQRLFLFGGMKGFLETMQRDNCQPDSRTLCLLGHCMDDDQEHQEKLFRLSNEFQVTRDVFFYETLIGLACRTTTNENRLEFAKRLLDLMALDGLRATPLIYEHMASGCDTLVDAKTFLRDLKSQSIDLSDELLSNLLKIAAYRGNFNYLDYLMRLCEVHRLNPDRKLVELLEKTRLKGHWSIIKYEKGQTAGDRIPSWVEQYERFSLSLNSWLKKVSIKEDPHPWAQFS